MCDSYEPGDTSTAQQHHLFYKSVATDVLMDLALTASLDERSRVAGKAIQLHHDYLTTKKKSKDREIEHSIITTKLADEQVNTIKSIKDHNLPMLNSRNDWTDWINSIEDLAVCNDIWNYCDPNGIDNLIFTATKLPDLAHRDVV